MCDGDSDGAAPDLTIRGDETRKKILIFAGGAAIFQRHAITS